MWVDVTTGFGSKWKQLFYDLEVFDGLDTDNVGHIWLLHHLFLPEINTDAQEWAGAWNNHTIALQGQRSRSPRDLFFFRMLQEGHRGSEVEADLTDDELAAYRVDWEALQDAQIRAHHDNTNQDFEQSLVDDQSGIDPQVLPGPARFSVVEVDEPHCPFTHEQLHWLDDQLSIQNFSQVRALEAYCLCWITALSLCAEIFVL